MALYKFRLTKVTKATGVLRDGLSINGDYWDLITFSTLYNCFDKERIKEFFRKTFNYPSFPFDCNNLRNAIINREPLYVTYNNQRLGFKLPENVIADLYVLLSNLSVLIGTFYKEEYSFLNIENSKTTIIDIGAFIGDTPIYFASKGAKKVIALEPNPPTYNLALDNIKLNRLEDKITLLNAGYGKKSGLVRVKSKEISGQNSLEESEDGVP
ncbi:MAG: FkbM family methyltransferase, partial [Sulfolobus sp.]|nr:FkbM family methyltransferase [Sulfolobus sp.]